MTEHEDQAASPDPFDSPGGESAPNENLPDIEFQSPGSFTVNNPSNERLEPLGWEPAPFVLGSDDELKRFSDRQEARAHALALLQQAQHSLCIYSTDLEPWLYHHSIIQTACTRFLLASPRNRLRILVHDATLAVRNGHRLLNLSKRLTSQLHIRCINPDYPYEPLTYLLADRSGLLIRPKPSEPNGSVIYQDPGRVRQQQMHFDQAWETSVSDPDLRSFLL